MAEDDQTPRIIAPPAISALRAEAEQDARVHMERTISMDIREEREDLKRAAEQSTNAILELDLEHKVRWASPGWQDLTGQAAKDIAGKPVADLIIGNQDVFAECVEAIRKDDSKSRIVRFAARTPGLHVAGDVLSAEDRAPMEPKPGFEMPSGIDFIATLEQTNVRDMGAETSPRSQSPATIQVDQAASTPQDKGFVELEAQGIMIYDRATGEESHTMWMVKPAVSREITIDLPEVLVESLGIGAEMLANYLTLLAEVGVHDPENHPPPLPVLCRICERHITPWWFEKHTELCSQEHRAEMEVQMAQDALHEQRSALVKVLDALEAQARHAKSPPADTGSPVPLPKAEYKSYPIGSSSAPSSGPSSGRASPAIRPARSRETSSGGLSHSRARSFAVRRPLARIVELVLDLCDTTMEISTPSIKDTKAYTPGELRTQSPQSEGRIQQVLQWQSPSASTLENEQGLALLCDDTSQLARSKVEAVFRHRRVLEYSERIRVEYEVLVQECIEAALQKAASIAAGEISDSSEDSSKYETPEQQPESAIEESIQDGPELSQFYEGGFAAVPQSHAGSPSSMAMALRHSSDVHMDRRTSSVGSSRASSPRGARTPKSYGGSIEPFALHKRGSVAFESDTGAESDTSMRSSAYSGGNRRAESPAAEIPLSRVASTRSRDRKRQSLVLPSLASQVRRQSPARGPLPPSSPLRMTKPRIPSSAADSLPSPITSPVLSTSEFVSPVIRAQHQHHHRRQSSNILGDALGRPSSPRLSAVVSNVPQPRAVQTSIKDFEIIKPISKGAFGSVYLSKKKSTGEYYAIKVLKKADMIAKNQVTNVKAERAIMMWQGESDYVDKLYWTFSSKEYLYLVMEYLNGGDCASLVKSLGSLSEDWTKKYISEILLCVQHLHSRQVVHRDLKPDNLLIDAMGHLKLTDFGLSRMGLIGRQKRAINAKPDDAPPDLLTAGPFRRAPSVTSSRSTSFDYQGNSQSPAQTPAMTPAYAADLGQPSYFSLNRESSRELSRRTSGHRSNSGDEQALESMFRRFSVADAGQASIEEETASEGADSPDHYDLHTIASNTSQPKIGTPPLQSMVMPPPMMSLFDPGDSDRRFVGTPDYLAPETIKGAGQDEMSDWWSIGCIMFEFLYGRPPFNADTPEKVFQNILARDIHWSADEEETSVSEEAKDLMDKLMALDPKERLGSNRVDAYANGGEEIKAHPWFSDINWGTIREDDASFVPMSENPEDTEYFDARGASMQNFAPEFQDEESSPAQTPGADYPERPHDALSRVRSQVNAVKRNLMPLHIPPHVRDARSRRLSEPVVADDFGNFQFKNLPVLEKANKDVIQKLKAGAMQAQSKPAGGQGSSSPAVLSPSPAPSLEASPILPMPLKRTLSANKGQHRSQSPSLLSHQSSSPSRASQPSSPLLVQFSAGQNHERRKTSSGSSGLSQQASNPSLQPTSFFEQVPRLAFKAHSNAPSPVKSMKTGSVSLPLPIEKSTEQSQRQNPGGTSSPRQRSHTVGSQDGDLVPELLSAHHKRRSGVIDISPSSSDNEETRQKALLRVQRRRQSSRRMSQISLMDGPTFRTLDVLVCEDHPVSRLVMERLLEKLRCRTIVVNNGSEAMRYAMSNVKFDIIMMEYKLPHMNGADVARMIRDTKNANSHTPIVCVTGYLKELQAPHHFDALLEKPPTKEKLENVMGQLCQWKPAPEGWKASSAQPIPISNPRHNSMATDDSPTTTSSMGGFSQAATSSTWRSTSDTASREDSISSFGEAESHVGSIPVIISRQATWDDELERNFGGLGISKHLSLSPEPEWHKAPLYTPPTLQHEVSAPAKLGTPSSSHQQGDPPLRRQPSSDAIEARRRSLEKSRLDSSSAAADLGDDEDEELGGTTLARQRSPMRQGSAKRASKLGTEMMRTNSQGSVISNEDVIASQKDAAAVGRGGSPTLEESSSVPAPAVHSIAEDPAAEVEASGRLTPPEAFWPGQKGDRIEVIDMDAPLPSSSLEGLGVGVDVDVTPRPRQGYEVVDPDPTPRASGSPSHRD
ncbi:rim15, signal transduction response regulator [Friedmanniomyces endolithicus]|nr:rim15, signal transduction response regulator [Friedmanniomyces endolithicus]KAK0290740.1 rim15, signal transduction response regulator [Friedmanniomyces endolithicus]KAK0997831.1 rim15, signal transduction response regulator [Friedmanniomyces endolithicus]